MEWHSPHAARRTVGAGRIVDMMVLNGWPFAWRAGHAAAVQEARVALDGLLALGLPHDSSDGAPLFDPAEVPHFIRWAGLYRRDPVYDRFVNAGRALVWAPHAPGGDRAGPPPLSALPVQRHTLTVWRTFNLGAAPGDTVRLRLPAPLDGTATLLAPAGIVQRHTIAPARIDIVATMPAGPLRLGVRMDVLDTGRLDTDAGDLALYLRPSEGLVQLDPRIRALAAHLAGDTGGLGTLRRFWDEILATLSLSSMNADWLDPVTPLHTVLDRHWCDCRSASALFVALCRARDIPARIVTGYTLYVTAPGFHTWAEAWVDGAWRPFDLLDLSCRGRDLAWQTLYFGQLRQRLAIERLPHAFTGLGAIRMPAGWHMLTRLTPAGTEVQFRTIGGDRLIYSDELVLGHQP